MAIHDRKDLKLTIVDYFIIILMKRKMTNKIYYYNKMNLY